MRWPMGRQESRSCAEDCYHTASKILILSWPGFVLIAYSLATYPPIFPHPVTHVLCESPVSIARQSVSSSRPRTVGYSRGQSMLLAAQNNPNSSVPGHVIVIYLMACSRNWLSRYGIRRCWLHFPPDPPPSTRLFGSQRWCTR